MPEKEETFDPKQANEAQINLCKEKGWPHFAPTGTCYSCRRNIYSEGGISVQRASTELITGCPHCHRSYCD